MRIRATETATTSVTPSDNLISPYINRRRRRSAVVCLHDGGLGEVAAGWLADGQQRTDIDHSSQTVSHPDTSHKTIDVKKRSNKNKKRKKT